MTGWRARAAAAGEYPLGRAEAAARSPRPAPCGPHRLSRLFLPVTCPRAQRLPLPAGLCEGRGRGGEGHGAVPKAGGVRVRRPGRLQTLPAFALSPAGNSPVLLQVTCKVLPTSPSQYMVLFQQPRSHV